MAFDERNRLFVDVVGSVDRKYRSSLDENISVKPIQAFGERNSAPKYLQERIASTVNCKALQGTTWCMVVDLLCTKIYVLENRHWDTRSSLKADRPRFLHLNWQRRIGELSFSHRGVSFVKWRLKFVYFRASFWMAFSLCKPCRWRSKINFYTHRAGVKCGCSAVANGETPNSRNTVSVDEVKYNVNGCFIS